MSAPISVAGHFAKLFNFFGREDCASFWRYAVVAFAIVMIGGMAVFSPVMGHALHSMQQFAAQHPDQATVTSGPGQYSITIRGNHPEFIPSNSIALFLGVFFGLAILLYAAAVARRLRDRGKSGWWGLMPIPFILYSSWRMPGMFAAVGPGRQPDLTVFLTIFLSNFCYLATLAFLIFLLAGPSERRGD